LLFESAVINDGREARRKRGAGGEKKRRRNDASKIFRSASTSVASSSYLSIMALVLVDDGEVNGNWMDDGSGVFLMSLAHGCDVTTVDDGDVPTEGVDVTTVDDGSGDVMTVDDGGGDVTTEGDGGGDVTTEGDCDVTAA
jgi:hypothetical protein